MIFDYKTVWFVMIKSKILVIYYKYETNKKIYFKEEICMSANVESMFYVRTAPWHGLGVEVKEALSSKDALKVAGLDWRVLQEDVYTDGGNQVEGYKANIRSSDRSVLGIVSNRYHVVQNEEAFEFTDTLLKQGVRYETAGSLQGGKKIWMLAKLPSEYIMRGDRISPYLVFSNSHDGSGAIKVALTPIRVVCQNTLNLALNTAQRSWSTKHTGDIKQRMEEAKATLFMAEKYMERLGKEVESLSKIKITDRRVDELIQELIPIPDEATTLQCKNLDKLREDVKMRYFYAPDLKEREKDGYRFINAISDFATHMEPLRKTASYKERLFEKTLDGNAFIDKAYQLVKAI